MVASGTICTGGCTCGGTPINKANFKKYEDAIESVNPLACPCAFEGTPRCVLGACVICGYDTPGCPDGG